MFLCKIYIYMIFVHRPAQARQLPPDIKCKLYTCIEDMFIEYICIKYTCLIACHVYIIFVRVSTRVCGCEFDCVCLSTRVVCALIKIFTFVSQLAYPRTSQTQHTYNTHALYTRKYTSDNTSQRGSKSNRSGTRAGTEVATGNNTNKHTRTNVYVCSSIDIIM